MAGGRQERTDDPADRGGLHPKGRNAMEDPGVARVAARRGGITGQRRPPARSRSARQRHRARAMSGSGAKLRRVSRSPSEWTETPKSDSATRSGVERGHAAGVRRCGIPAPKSQPTPGYVFVRHRVLYEDSRTPPLAPSAQFPILFAGSQTDADRTKPGPSPPTESSA